MPVNSGRRSRTLLAAALAAAGGCAQTPTRQPVRQDVVLVRPATRATTAPGPVQSSPVAGVPVTRSPVIVAPVTTGPTAVAVVPPTPAQPTPAQPTPAQPMPGRAPAVPVTRPAEVATADLNDPYKPVPGLAKPPKPFIALPKFSSTFAPPGRPSTELVTHLSPDSPVSIADFANQPVYTLEQFRLSAGLTTAAVQARFGLPAALADAEDPWFVYRLVDGRELWLHFTTAGDRLRSADVVHGVENGYERKTVFP